MRDSSRIYAEDKAGSNRGANNLVGHFGAHHVVESLSGAMAGYQIIRIDVLEGCDDLPNVLVGQWRHDVESTDNRMHLLDARSGLCLFDRIDDTTVTAGCQNDQPLAFDNEVRTDLMLKIIGNKTIGIFCRRHLLRETSETIDDPDLLAAWSQRLLETGLRDFAGSKGMIGHHCRPFSHHEREVRVRDCLAVERAILAGIGLADAKTVLSANEERKAVLEFALVRREEADQTTEMIVMHVA